MSSIMARPSKHDASTTCISNLVPLYAAKVEPEPRSLVSAFNEAGYIGHHEACFMRLHDAEVGHNVVKW
jgi:hypothetical protein